MPIELVAVQTYDEWFDEVKKIAIEKYGFTRASADSFDKDAWKESFNNGLDPDAALLEDMSNY